MGLSDILANSLFESAEQMAEMSARDLRRKLRDNDCVELRQSGSHLQVKCGGCQSTVPVHGSTDIKKGTLKSIERSLGACLGPKWTKVEFLDDDDATMRIIEGEELDEGKKKRGGGSDLLERELHQINDAWFTGVRRWWNAQAAAAKQYPGRVESGPFEDKEQAKAAANAAFRAIDTLRQSVERFADDLFVNKGLWQPDGQQIAKIDRKFGGTPKVWKEKTVDAVRAARSALSDARSRVEYLLDGMTADESNYRWDVRFHVNEAGWNLAMKSIAVSVDDAVDAASKAVLGLLKALSRVYNSRTSLEPWEPGGDTVPDVVDVAGVKLVFGPLPEPTRAMRMEPDVGYVDPRKRADYISELLKAKALLQKRGLGFLWYGNFFVRPEGEAPKNHLGAHFGVGAYYRIERDEVTIFSLSRSLHVLVAHELGHRLWFKFLSQAQRAGFKSYFKDVAAVSEYGGTNAEEDFAEVFAHYINGRELTRDQIERFKAFAKGKWKMESLSEELEAALTEGAWRSG